MTLIIFSRYKDGIIIISDRQGSLSTGERRSVKKIYSHKNKDYYLSLAGDASRIEQIYFILDQFSISKNELRTKLKSFIDQTYFKTSEDIEGVLLIKNKNNYNTFRVSGNYDNARILELDSPFECYGLSGAKSVANFLARFETIENFDLEKAIDYLLAIMNSISGKFDGISTIDDGFDIVAFSDNGEVYERFRFNTKGTGMLNFSFITSKKVILEKFIKISPLGKKTKVSKHGKRKKEKKIKVKTPPKIPEIIPTPQPLFNITRPTCIQCGRNLGILERIDSEGRCSVCVPPQPLFNITRPTCIQCGRNLGILERIDSEGRCSVCVPPQPLFNITRPTCIQCGRNLGILERIDSEGRCSTCSSAL